MAEAAEDPALAANFAAAGNAVKVGGAGFSDDDKLRLYALFKQATVGPCNTAKPGFFDFTGKAKWEAWNQMGDVAASDAQQTYVETVSELLPSWTPQSSSAELAAVAAAVAADAPQPKAGFGPVSSTLGGGEESSDDDDGSEEDKDALDWAQEGDLEEIALLLAENAHAVIELRDDEGMSALHWACDRGHAHVAKALIEAGCDLGAKDGDGQTPLHYAVMCDHIDVVRLLVLAGADVAAKDSDGTPPVEHASTDEMKALLEPAP